MNMKYNEFKITLFLHLINFILFAFFGGCIYQLNEQYNIIIKNQNLINAKMDFLYRQNLSLEAVRDPASTIPKFNIFFDQPNFCLGLLLFFGIAFLGILFYPSSSSSSTDSLPLLPTTAATTAGNSSQTGTNEDFVNGVLFDSYVMEQYCPIEKQGPEIYVGDSGFADNLDIIPYKSSFNFILSFLDFCQNFFEFVMAFFSNI